MKIPDLWWVGEQTLRDYSEWSAAYRSTRYTVANPQLTIRIGTHHPDLDRLLEPYRATTWAYLTAWNPGSILLEPAENEQRQNALLADLRAWAVFPGKGIPDAPGWPPEDSVLIVGIAQSDAVRLARAWGQLALVCGTAGKEARLVWVDET